MRSSAARSPVSGPLHCRRDGAREPLPRLEFPRPTLPSSTRCGTSLDSTPGRARATRAAPCRSSASGSRPSRPVAPTRPGPKREGALAALEALCRYWERELPADPHATLALRAAEGQRLRGAELRTTLRGLELEVFLFRGTLARAPTGILGHLDARRPLLVMLQPDGPTTPSPTSGRAAGTSRCSHGAQRGPTARRPARANAPGRSTSSNAPD